MASPRITYSASSITAASIAAPPTASIWNWTFRPTSRPSSWRFLFVLMSVSLCHSKIRDRFQSVPHSGLGEPRWTDHLPADCADWTRRAVSRLPFPVDYDDAVYAVAGPAVQRDLPRVQRPHPCVRLFASLKESLINSCKNLLYPDFISLYESVHCGRKGFESSVAKEEELKANCVMLLRPRHSLGVAEGNIRSAERRHGAGQGIHHPAHGAEGDVATKSGRFTANSIVAEGVGERRVAAEIGRQHAGEQLPTGLLVLSR